MIVIDSFCGHLTDDMIKHHEESCTNIVIIAGYCMYLLQTFVVCINRPFESNLWQLLATKLHQPAE